ncbi:hypothetical protein FNV43_RR07211 [Rhamnella rubrinervis]|uniref:Uncharacterized protein n=1 Tax=Rhamnella rubrinervis TaxID=2594499 RepID=A0A8K0HEI1_9ROSA|nr:hypothetical protein FNV43_RR07211 [Rhamnella rubrinervis]
MAEHHISGLWAYEDLIDSLWASEASACFFKKKKGVSVLTYNTWCWVLSRCFLITPWELEVEAAEMRSRRKKMINKQIIDLEVLLLLLLIITFERFGFSSFCVLKNIARLTVAIKSLLIPSTERERRRGCDLKMVMSVGYI